MCSLGSVSSGPKALRTFLKIHFPNPGRCSVIMGRFLGTVCEFYLNKTVFKIKLSKETENEFSVFLAMPLVLRGTVLA